MKNFCFVFILDKRERGREREREKEKEEMSEREGKLAFKRSIKKLKQNIYSPSLFEQIKQINLNK